MTTAQALKCTTKVSQTYNANSAIIKTDLESGEGQFPRRVLRPLPDPQPQNQTASFKIVEDKPETAEKSKFRAARAPESLCKR